jgi:2-oxoisovalerate dehydrogenase E2 component (dihydrolipoyl transacylase)
MKTFLLPDLAEGLAEAEINEWHVNVGDTVKIDQPLVSVETAKAVVEVPSPYRGKILALHGMKGDIIGTGKPLVDFELSGDNIDNGSVVGTVEIGNEMVQTQYQVIDDVLSSSNLTYKASPAVRALAKKIGVELNQVLGTGLNQTITAQDIERAAKKTASTGIQLDFEPIKGVRRQMVLSMQKAHAEVVPVTIYDDVDISAWLQKDYSARLLLALCSACQQEPALNAWYDGAQVARRIFKEVNIGVAMDTQDGLFVPVITHAEEKNAQQLRQELESIKIKVQTRTVTPKEMTGATIMLSNFGKFAGRYASPIVVPPIVAILAVGKIRSEVKLNSIGEPKEHQLMPLSLTFDHRAVTGGEATRFLGHVMSALEKSE